VRAVRIRAIPALILRLARDFALPQTFSGGITLGLCLFIHSSVDDRQERPVQENTRISSADTVAGSRVAPTTVAVSTAVPQRTVLLFFQLL
jgi:hypothetical protein